MSITEKMRENSYLFGGSNYLDSFYEDYINDPSSVPVHLRQYFDGLKENSNGIDVSHAQVREHFLQHAKQVKTQVAASADAGTLRKQAQVESLVNAYRSHGHHHSTLDPLQLHQRPHISDLDLKTHGLTQQDLATHFSSGDFPNLSQASLKEIHQTLQQTYCGNIGVEYTHITDNEELAWLKQRIETTRARPQFDAEFKKRILSKVLAAEGFEKYLGTRFVGQKRFSLEGGESFIPMIDELIQRGGAQGVKESVIAMAHRGRLNVLINIFGKSTESLFKEFEGSHKEELRSGDVKYHMGFSSDVKTPGGPVHIALAFNPSHLEIISPVVEGSVRARQERRQDPTHASVLPIIIHGDAAVAGQGVVMETLNMSQARGYATGGSIHIVINNQIGFTTSNPLDARSTLYCTDIFKVVQAPVFHVNADDPEAVLFATQIALDFRMKFKRDVVIDLVCYRRHGHNEADEPFGTQPLMYAKIKNQPSTATLYSEQLIKENVVDKAWIEQANIDYREALDAGTTVVDELVSGGHMGECGVDWSPYLDTEWTDTVPTKITKKTLATLAKKLDLIPEGFELQRQVAKMHADRHKMSTGELPINWGYGETMAYASLLNEGYIVRLSGQDCGRGTFSHRHAVLHCQKSGDCYAPLENLSQKPKQLTVIDSVLSEEAVLAFEYGYSTTEPRSLVIWEAQFGDFANGAQVVIDQFISSGDQKWGRLCGLVMLLPHGYEGMGPEHSSARLERYLQLCAQQNMQVCVPSTPAQIFHLLRRQAVRPFRKPLIIMSPKSLLRHPLATSTLDELTDGEFQLVIPEVDDIKPDSVKRVVLCSGKVYYELLQKRREEKLKGIAIVRVEQLYPFPRKEVKKILQHYKKATEVVWCQEEPRNQGAWFCIRHYLEEVITQAQGLRYAGRTASASPAVGTPAKHIARQNAVSEHALVLKLDELPSS